MVDSTQVGHGQAVSMEIARCCAEMSAGLLAIAAVYKENGKHEQASKLQAISGEQLAAYAQIRDRLGMNSDMSTNP